MKTLTIIKNMTSNHFKPNWKDQMKFLTAKISTFTKMKLMDMNNINPKQLIMEKNKVNFQETQVFMAFYLLYKVQDLLSQLRAPTYL